MNVGIVPDEIVPDEIVPDEKQGQQCDRWPLWVYMLGLRSSAAPPMKLVAFHGHKSPKVVDEG